MEHSEHQEHPLEHRLRIVNDTDRQILAWLSARVDEVRIGRALHQLGRYRKPYVSALCRYLGVRPPISIVRPAPRTITHHAVGDHYLSLIRQHLAHHAAR